MIEISLDRPPISSAVQAAAKQAASLGRRCGAPGLRLAQAAYSVIFNLRYYQGVADELGGRKVFFSDAKAGPAL